MNRPRCQGRLGAEGDRVGWGQRETGGRLGAEGRDRAGCEVSYKSDNYVFAHTSSASENDSIRRQFT